MCCDDQLSPQSTAASRYLIRLLAAFGGKAADQRAPVPMRLSANGQSIISTSPFSEEYIAESLTVAEVCVEVCVAFAARTGGEANALINLVLPTGLIRMLHMLTAVRRLRRLSADFAGLGSNQRFKSSTENAKRKRARTRQALYSFGTPYRIRTGVTAVRGRRPEPLDEGSIYCFVSIKLSFVEAGLTRRILRLALRANSLRSFVQNRSCDFVEPGYRRERAAS